MTEPPDSTKQMLTPDKMRKAARDAVQLALPHLDREGRNLIYILSQSARIGHFGLETQIIRPLHEDSYDRIVIVTGSLDEPGTNPWIPACAGSKIRFAHTDDLSVLLLGQIDAGLQMQPGFDLLLASPRSIITAFYRHILDGGAVKPLILAERVEAQARSTLGRQGIDPDRPFVMFHNRTLHYRPTMGYHGHRTADVATYRDSIARLLAAGYRVIRLGEAGLDTMGFDPSAYVNVPDWQDNDRAVDLYVCARCAFAIAQNSGPIWVAAAFGRPVLRTNTPFEHLNLPYNDDLSLFKHYRRIGTTERLTYRQILEKRLPALFQDADIAAAGYELVPNSPDELLSATDEMLERTHGRQQADALRQERFQTLGQDYERGLRADPEMVRQNLAFYGYAHPYGEIAHSFLNANPGFLD